MLNPSDENIFVDPGVVFPIQTHEGGVLKRAGRPEALIDLLIMADLKPFGLTSLILKDNGEPYLLDKLNVYEDKISVFNNYILGTGTYDVSQLDVNSFLLTGNDKTFKFSLIADFPENIISDYSNNLLDVEGEWKRN